MRQLRLLVTVSALVGLCGSLVNAPATLAGPPQRSASTGPSARRDLSLATDPAGHVVLFGGYHNALLNDTWTWNGTTWTERHPASAPSPRLAAMMAYDEGHGQVVLFGGTDDHLYFNDTWIWGGSNWHEMHPATSPPADCCGGMAYDPSTRRVVLFGVGTWTWDGTTWREELPLHAPGGRVGPAMARSSWHEVLFGGEICLEECSYAGDTWGWTGEGWHHPDLLTSPRRRSFAAMAYDPIADQTVLFGGENEHMAGFYFRDTWVWDGKGWTQQDPADQPLARSRFGLAFDPTSQVLVLFGGAGRGEPRADTWTWDGSTWTCVANCP